MSAARLTHIWRHPIKGIGTEALEAVTLTAGRPLPWDRAWAVLEDGGEANPGWRPCRNFIRGAKGPSLMAVTARKQGDSLLLSHPERSDLTVTPGDNDAALLDWLRPIYPTERPAPVALVPAPPEGMSDAPFSSVSILNLASLRAVSQRAGRPLDMRRFRGNLWIDGWAPWEEADLIGKTLEIGETRLKIVEPIGRCRATEANPDTGRRDTPMLQILEEGWGHTEFGVYAMVEVGGEISTGDTVCVA